MKLNNFFTSGWTFDNENMLDLKSRYQMVNIAIILSSLSLFYAIIVNVVRQTPTLIPIEIFLIITDFIFFSILRVKKKYFESVATLMTAQFTFFFIYLVYVSEPSALKHVWLFTYPIILLYFQGTRRGAYWFSTLMFLLLVAPFQPFVEVQYTAHQVTYIAFTLVIVNIVTYFYQRKMDEAKKLIIDQQNNLKSKIQELEAKDKLLTAQSKQAVMGEMIAMIAHQWRQPLSTITLQISNLELRKLLGEDISSSEIDTTFKNINKSIMYLSDTIDDFQKYFHPDKESVEVELHALVNKSINFVLPRLKNTHIKILFERDEDIFICTYKNELIQIVLNILNNAIDALIEYDRAKPSIILNVFIKDNCVYIRIKDNAAGIDKKDIPYIFEPYFSTKGKDGTGLGLYMSQMIAQKQFSGNIEVQTSNKGTVFTVRVPQKLS